MDLIRMPRLSIPISVEASESIMTHKFPTRVINDFLLLSI